MLFFALLAYERNNLFAGRLYIKNSLFANIKRGSGSERKNSSNGVGYLFSKNAKIKVLQSDCKF